MWRRRGRSPESPAAATSRREAGFTLVEVLVVMLVMGIMMGIALPSFFNQRTRADDSSSKSAARAAAVAIEAYASDNLGSYVGATNTKLNAIDSAVPANTVVDVYSGCNTGAPLNLPLCWVLTMPPNTSTNHVFRISKRNTGQIISDCDITPPTTTMEHGDGGCPSSGHWGPDGP